MGASQAACRQKHAHAGGIQTDLHQQTKTSEFLSLEAMRDQQEDIGDNTRDSTLCTTVTRKLCIKIMAPKDDSTTQKALVPYALVG